MTFADLCAVVVTTPLSRAQKVALRKAVQAAPKCSRGRGPSFDPAHFRCGHVRAGKECRDCKNAKKRDRIARQAAKGFTEAARAWR